MSDAEKALFRPFERALKYDPRYAVDVCRIVQRARDAKAPNLPTDLAAELLKWVCLPADVAGDPLPMLIERAGLLAQRKIFERGPFYTNAQQTVMYQLSTETIRALVELARADGINQARNGVAT